MTARTPFLRTRQTPAAPWAARTRLDVAIALSILLMLSMNVVTAFGDLGPSAAYAAVPM